MKYILRAFFCALVVELLCPHPALSLSPPPSKVVELKTTHDCIAVYGGYEGNHPLKYGTFNKGPAVVVENGCAGEFFVTSFVERKDGADYTTGEPVRLPRYVAPRQTVSFKVTWGSRFEIRGELHQKDRRESVEASGRIIHPYDVRYSPDYFEANSTGNDPEVLLPYADFLLESAQPDSAKKAERLFMRVVELTSGQKKAQGDVTSSLRGENNHKQRSYFSAASKLAHMYEKQGRYEEAYAWYDNASKAGIFFENCTMAYYWEAGLGRDKSERRALAYWLYRSEAGLDVEGAEGLYTAAMKGDAQAKVRLAGAYFYSECQRNQKYKSLLEQKFLAILKPLSEARSSDADVLMGDFYARRNDANSALASYRKSADAGNRAGLLGISRLYMRGAGVPRDVQKAEQIVRDLAERGYGPAQYRLSELFAVTTKEKSHPEAYFWLLVAYKNGLGALPSALRDGNHSKRLEDDRLYVWLQRNGALTETMRKDIEAKAALWTAKSD